jgi:hypothetical protein
MLRVLRSCTFSHRLDPLRTFGPAYVLMRYREPAIDRHDYEDDRFQQLISEGLNRLVSI